jgi:hypothetical protein
VAPAADVAPLPDEGVSEHEPPDEPPALARDLEGVRAMWSAVVELVKGENGLLGALIAEAWPVAVEGEDLTLAFAASAQFLKKKAEDPANRMTVGEALRAVTGVRWRLSYELREDGAGGQPAGGGELSEEDWVRRFIEEFDAEEIPAVTTNEKGA